MNETAQLKTCITCGGTIQKKQNVSRATYQLKKFCSRHCRDVAPRPYKRNGALVKCPICGEKRYRPRCELAMKHCSTTCANKSKVGKKATIATRKKMSAIQKKRALDGKNILGDGTKTPENIKIRMSFEYKIWREKVFKRDNFTCKACGDRPRAKHRVVLQADHIKSFARYPKYRFLVSNGRTLCITCHKKTATYLNRWYN
jgi:hypothetical protein